MPLTSDTIVPFTLGPLVFRSTHGAISVNNIGFTAIFDVNADGFDDIIGTGAYYPNETYPAFARPGFLLLGSPDGFVAATLPQFDGQGMLTVHAREIVFADFNEDGIPDFYIADHGYDAPPFPGQQNRLYLSSGPSSWDDATGSLPPLADFTHSATTGDVNGDGHQDIFAGNGGLNAGYILLGDGEGHFTKSTALLPIEPGNAIADASIGVYSCLITDLDDDGLPELVLGTAELHSTYQVLWNAGGSYASGDFTDLPSPTDFGEGWMVYDIQSTDVNFDGLADLVLAYCSEITYGGWRLQVLVNQGQRQFTDETATFLPYAAVVNSGVPTAQSLAAWIQFLVPRDLNGDGRTDFVVDGKSNGGGLPDSFPLALIHQDDGTFAPITVGALRDQGMPDSMLWNVSFVSAGSSGAGEFDNIYYSDQGRPVFNVLPVSFAAGATHWVAGTSGSDMLAGTSGADWMAGFGGNDTLAGGVGIDSAVYRVARADFAVARAADAYSVTDLSGNSGIDILDGVERASFSDVRLALDLEADQNGGQAIELFGILAPGLLHTPATFGSVLALFDDGRSLHEVCQLLLDAGIVALIAGSSSDTALVGAMYRNVIGSEATADTVGLLVGYLDGRIASFSQAEFMTLVAGLEINQDHIGLAGLQQTGIEYL